MGVLLTPIVPKRVISLDDLAGRRLAVDGNGELYQFLALIRLPDGTPLTGNDGRVTSHLVGLFDRRRETRRRYETEAEAARTAGETARAYAKSTMTSRLTREMTAEATELLTLLGVPVIQAPGEGEAQASMLAQRGDVWAAASKDYDTLLFGTPRLLRFLTLTGKEFLPSAGAFRPITPELIETDALLASLGITHAQLIDLAILVGTDFNEGIKGIGPKKALKLVQTYGAIEEMNPEIRAQVPQFAAVRRIYQEPTVAQHAELKAGPRDDEGVVKMLCGTRRFSETRVRAALERMRAGADRRLL
jgi:flap endonuclease-1